MRDRVLEKIIPWGRYAQDKILVEFISMCPCLIILMYLKEHSSKAVLIKFTLVVKIIIKIRDKITLFIHGIFIS